MWRYCDKCHVMFYDGYPNKGYCAGSGGHEAQGYDFFLPYDVAETPNAQASWRYCTKCHAMFFDGYPDKGHCPAGSGHVAQGFLFTLPHDISETGNAQSNWRYCELCHAMFFDGYADKGHCEGALVIPVPHGGPPRHAGHQAAGFMFVLPHDIPAGPRNPTITLRAVADQGRFIEVAGNGFTPSQEVKLGYDISSGGGPTTHETGEDTLTSDFIGSFTDRIPVNLGGDISGAEAEATDVASGATATASI
jgi:hypothetical protein